MQMVRSCSLGDVIGLAAGQSWVSHEHWSAFSRWASGAPLVRWFIMGDVA